MPDGTIETGATGGVPGVEALSRVDDGPLVAVTSGDD
jgi:hypothetical protein